MEHAQAYSTYDNPAGARQREKLQAQGYDGVIVEEDGRVIEYIAFSPNQIKSVDNVGYFDSENDDIRFMFLGEKGATAMDAAEEATTRLDNLAVAREMENSGNDALSIKQATGWERGADQMWRYEVPDVVINQTAELVEDGDVLTTTLGSLVLSDELFNAYPELRDTKVIFKELPEGRYGSYAEGTRDYMFTSVTILRDGKEVLISNQEKETPRIKRLLKEGTLAYINKATLPSESTTSAQGDQSTIPGGVSYSESKDTRIIPLSQTISPKLL